MYVGGRGGGGRGRDLSAKAKPHKIGGFGESVFAAVRSIPYLATQCIISPHLTV